MFMFVLQMGTHLSTEEETLCRLLNRTRAELFWEAPALS